MYIPHFVYLLTWVASVSWLLLIMLLWSWVCKKNFFWDSAFKGSMYFGDVPRSGMAGSYRCIFFYFLRSHHIIPKSFKWYYLLLVIWKFMMCKNESLSSSSSSPKSGLWVSVCFSSAQRNVFFCIYLIINLLHLYFWNIWSVVALCMFCDVSPTLSYVCVIHSGRLLWFIYDLCLWLFIYFQKIFTELFCCFFGWGNAEYSDICLNLHSFLFHVSWSRKSLTERLIYQYEWLFSLQKTVH